MRKLLLLFALVTSCYAQTSWSKPEVLRQGDVRDVPAISVNENNQAMVIWCEHNGDKQKEQLWTRLYSDGWQSAVKCSGTAKDYLVEPKIALNREAHALAVWRRYDLGEGVRDISFRTADYVKGNWKKPEALYMLPVGDIYNHGLALNDQGDGVAIFITSWGGYDFVNAAIYKDGIWPQVQTVSSNDVIFPGGDGDEPRRIQSAKVALTASGDKMIVWDFSDGMHTMIKAAFRSRDDVVWSKPVVISEVLGMNVAGWPQIAMNNQGEVIAIWSVVKNDKYVLEMATFSNGSWTSPTELQAELFAWNGISQVALNEQGDAIVTWQSEGQLFAMQRNQGKWGKAVAISQPGWICYDHKMVMNEAGLAVVIHNAMEKYTGTDPFPLPTPPKGFVTAFVNGAWEAPTPMFSNIADVDLNNAGKSFVIGKEDNSIQASCRQF